MPAHPGPPPSPGRVGDHVVLASASMWAAGRPRARRRLRACDGDRPRPAPPGRPPAWRPPGPAPARAAGSRPAGPGGAVARAHRRAGRPRGADRGRAGQRPLVPQWPPARPNPYRAGRPAPAEPFLEGHVRGRCGPCPTCGSWTPATSSGWPRRPRVAASGTRVRRRVEGGAEGCFAPTWWSTPPAAAPPQPGWRHSATRLATDRAGAHPGRATATRTYRLPPDARRRPRGAGRPHPTHPRAARCCWWRVAGGW